MTLPQTLPMFLLPRLPRTARVLGPLDGWREGLEQAQVELVGSDDADLVVAPASHARAAARAAPHGLLLEGRRRPGSLHGFTAHTWMAVPGREQPEALLPTGRFALVRYAVAAGAGGRRARLASGRVAALGLAGAPTVVASRDGAQPALVAGAAQLEPEIAAASPLPVLGRWGDPFSRGVLLLFPSGSALPRWALKFARVPGNDRPFELDERALRLAAAAGGVVAAQAPRLLGRFEVDRLACSVETATVGRRLLPVLGSSLTRERKLVEVERIAAWIEAVAAETSGRAGGLEAERTRLAGEVLPAWADRGVPQDLADNLAGLPSVFEHGDLWPDNVVVADGSFGVLDWEAARDAGAPLWDLLYFLTAALAFVDGTASEAEQEEHFVRLYRGELPSSRLLFEWVARVASASAVPPEAVGPLATLRVVSLASEDLRHAERTAAAGDAPGVPISARLAARWLADPALGPAWDRWRA